MPLISVIVPVYNVEAYLNRCVDSILTQTFTNFELMLVDDGSTDGSGSICDSYLDKDSRVIVFHKPNGGLSDARNYGLDRMSGVYVAFIDSDDWIDSRYFETLLHTIQTTGSQISQCNFRFVFEDGTIKEPEYGYCEQLILTKKDAIRSLVESKWFDGLYIPVWGKLYSSALFEKVRFQKGRIHEDNFMTFDIAIKGNYWKIVTNPDILYNYYKRKGGLSTEWENPKEITDKFAAHLYFLETITPHAPEYLIFWNNTIKWDFFHLLRLAREINFIFPKELKITISKILNMIPLGEMFKNNRKLYNMCFLVMRGNFDIGFFAWKMLHFFIR